jgi:hypothetical protein
MAKVAQSLQEGFYEAWWNRANTQEANPIDSSLVLGLQRNWPRQRATSKRDELPPSHSITSDAAASKISSLARHGQVIVAMQRIEDAGTGRANFGLVRRS